MSPSKTSEIGQPNESAKYFPVINEIWYSKKIVLITKIVLLFISTEIYNPIPTNIKNSNCQLIESGTCVAAAPKKAVLPKKQSTLNKSLFHVFLNE